MWKVFNKDLQCHEYQFKIGRQEKIAGKIELCKRGFHFHTKPCDLFNYYEFNPSNRVCEVKVGGTIIHGDDKSVCSDIEIIRELTWHEVLNLVNVGKNNTGKNNSGQNNFGNENSGNGNSGNGNSGHGNSGHRNSGNENSGDRNSGNRNSGHRNSGHGNSGHRNSGNENSDDRNSGNRNSGYGNSGNNNSGNRNSGNGNSGFGNSGNSNSGFFNSISTPVYAFNKPTSLTYLQYPIIQIYPILTEFILSQDMTDTEKSENPNYETLEGYWKAIPYKEAWKKAWNKATTKERDSVLKLPNFDATVFEEITGIKA